MAYSLGYKGALIKEINMDIIFDEIIQVTDDTLDDLDVTEEVKADGGIEDENN